LLIAYPSICLQGYLICVPVNAEAVPRTVGEMPQQLQSLLLTLPQRNALEQPSNSEADAVEDRGMDRIARSSAS